MPDLPWSPEDVDPAVPSAARVYDYLLGGSHNFTADRALAEAVMRAAPDLRELAMANRAFLGRAVRYMCGQGIDQFLDLGSGIPTVGSVHEIAHAVDPAARVVYVDRDPVAITHSEQILAGDARVLVVGGDLREPAQVLDGGVRAHLDLDRPVGVLLLAVLHFITAEDRSAAGLVEEFTSAVAPGSHVAISHATYGQGMQDAGESFVRAKSRDRGQLRTYEEICALFGSMRVLDPGVVRMPLWRPDDPRDVPADPESYAGYAGVGVR